jgi:hypothetical protein
MLRQVAEIQMDQVESDWQQVRAQLADSNWDFRTVESLSKTTGLSAERVSDLLSEHGDEVRIANVPDKRGRFLYTLSDRPMKLQELLANVRAFITKTL